MNNDQINALVNEFVICMKWNTRNFKRAHEIRTQLTAEDIQLIATVGGTTWKRRT